MYDCRTPFLEALEVLATFEDEDDFARDNRMRRTAYGALRNFHHHYEVWQYNFEELLDAVERKPIERLYAMSDEMLNARRFMERGFRRDWEPQAIKTGRKWKTIRRLARKSAAAATELLDPIQAYETLEIAPDFPIVTYSGDQVPSSLTADSNDELETGAWYAVRKCVLLESSCYGHVGPDDPSDTKQFWLVDDCLNDKCFQYMEILDPSVATKDWIAAMIHVLQAFPKWGLGVTNLSDGYLLIFGDRLMVTGPSFASCRTVSDVGKALGTLIA